MARKRAKTLLKRRPGSLSAVAQAMTHAAAAAAAALVCFCSRGGLPRGVCVCVAGSSRREEGRVGLAGFSPGSE